MIAILCWKPMKVSRLAASARARTGPRAASTPRESWLEIAVMAGAISPTASTTAGTAAAVPSEPRGPSRSASRAAASIPNGATIAR